MNNQKNWPPQDQWPTFIFYRRSQGTYCFYPVSLPNEEEVVPNVECNPGTYKVTDTDGRVIWSLQ